MSALIRTASILACLVAPTVTLASGASQDACPADRPLAELLLEHPLAERPSGELLVDRDVFWSTFRGIVKRGEVFRFKDGPRGEVSFTPSAGTGDRLVTVESIFKRWESLGGGHPKHLALILGTAYRETCGWVVSTVGEACGCSKTCTKSEHPSASYGQKNSCGLAYFGRGLVQLTHDYNYRDVSLKLGAPLLDYPDLAYNHAYAVALLVDGVLGRWYAGDPLTQYLDDSKSNWSAARRAVNPKSPNKAATGWLSCRLYDAIQPAYLKPAPAQDPSICAGIGTS